ncbi:MAG: hypothetical protein QOJ02_3807 [Acidobacteriota bacterium]|jgi:hypothetical protein|nr:hypothetical protein [Acidobacteriota bacterium]
MSGWLIVAIVAVGIILIRLRSIHIDFRDDLKNKPKIKRERKQLKD